MQHFLFSTPISIGVKINPSVLYSNKPSSTFLRIVLQPSKIVPPTPAVKKRLFSMRNDSSFSNTFRFY